MGWGYSLQKTQSRFSPQADRLNRQETGPKEKYPVDTTQPASVPSGLRLIRTIIGEQARRVGVPIRLALAVAKLESAFNPTARNASGAAGLFQLLPAAIADVTARRPEFGHRLNLFDPTWNAAVGTTYLKICAEYIGADIDQPDDWPMIYAAYNIGAGNVRRLLTGRTNTRVEKAIMTQAANLRSGGSTSYLANVKTAMSDAIAALG